MAHTDTPPSDSMINTYAAPGDYVDCFSISLADRPDLQSCDARLLADHFGNVEFAWGKALIKMRNVIVRPFGLKTTADFAADQKPTLPRHKQVGDRVNFFKIYAIEQDEILLGEDDRHQDFRVSMMRTTGLDAKLYMTTCCKRHNWFGYVYLALILPIHKLLVKAILDKATTMPLRVQET